MLRRFLLFLSREQRLRRSVETSPLAHRLAHRFVAGTTLEQALGVCRRVNAEGISATLDYLGENVGRWKKRHIAGIYICGRSVRFPAPHRQQRLSKTDAVRHGYLRRCLPQ